MARSPGTQEFVHSETNVRGDLAEQRWRDITTDVEGHGGRAAVGVTELLVRSAPTYLPKAVGLEQSDDLPGA